MRQINNHKPAVVQEKQNLSPGMNESRTIWKVSERRNKQLLGQFYVQQKRKQQKRKLHWLSVTKTQNIVH